jgi:hypothetical protein
MKYTIPDTRSSVKRRLSMAKIQAIQPGYCVALHLLPESAPENCYIGIVHAVDDFGVLVNLVHWDDKLDMVGGYTESIFVPWMNINAMLVSTETTPSRRFLSDRARKWKTQIDAMYGNESLPSRKK